MSACQPPYLAQPALDNPLRWGRDEWLSTALLVATVLGAYHGVLQCEFVNFDDPIFVTNNDRIRAGLKEIAS